jgi:hypothetical protein
LLVGLGLGLAIGAAWSGLLANFAAGAFLIIFYKVGGMLWSGVSKAPSQRSACSTPRC